MDCLSFISLNTRGTLNKIDRIIREVDQYDIILLQEQTINDNIIKLYQNKLKCQVFYSTDDTNDRSIVTLIKQKFHQNIKQTEILIKGRLIKTIFHIDNKRYTILNIYGPAQLKDRKNFWNNAFDRIKNEKNIIKGGDLNLVLSKEDTDGTFKKSKNTTDYQKTLNSMNLIDIHTHMSSENMKYTYAS